MKKILVLLMTLLMTLGLTGCGDSGEKNSSEKQTAATTEKAPEKNKSKILVAFFSRTGDNYEVGKISKGNTHIVADMIAEKTGADMFEIKTVKTYPADYRACTEEAKVEIETNARPEIAEKLAGLENYDTIFLGYPIWWNDFPMVIYTFLESYDFNGKTIIPFCTAGQDYMTGKEGQIPEIAKGAKVLEGIGIRGKRAQETPEEVKKEVYAWLEKLNY